ncbi:glycoside hydrolase family 5 protein [Xylariaceae sp. FL1019]|nr:glycoside hydrolase family 5 protein [Xylariaceae sp. FL1019]
MKTSLLALGALALHSSVASPLHSTRAAATTWMGTNLYYLQGLSETDQDSYINTLADYGVKVVRVWANAQPGNGECVKGSKSATSVPAFETSIGTYNYATLDALDLVINKLAQKGMKVVISPHDGNSLIGDYRKDVYYDNWGADGFYTNSDARSAYKNRIDAMVNYQGKTSGKVWKDWTDAILAFDLQNEPMCADTSLCQNNDKAGWLCDIALAMRISLGGENPIKIATGSVGGDASNNCITISAATNCGQIDIIAAHKYAGPQSSNGGQWSNSASSWLSASNGKLVFIEEWGANSALASQSSDLPAQAADIDAGGIPNLYWQFLPPQNSACPYDPKNDDGDHFGVYVGGDVDIKSAVQKANSATAKQDWSAIVP